MRSFFLGRHVNTVNFELPWRCAHQLAVSAVNTNPSQEKRKAMSSIQFGRLTVENGQDLVVLLIGARINRLWLLPVSLPILASMNRMVRELLADPESGLLAVQSLGMGNSVQYWKSYEHLHRYANNPQKTHRPTWSKYFARLFKNWAIGIWHETFIVSAGNYESIYTNMPRTGLGKHFALIPATGSRKTSSGRLTASSMSANTGE